MDRLVTMVGTGAIIVCAAYGAYMIGSSILHTMGVI